MRRRQRRGLFLLLAVWLVGPAVLAWFASSHLGANRVLLESFAVGWLAAMGLVTVLGFRRP